MLSIDTAIGRFRVTTEYSNSRNLWRNRAAINGFSLCERFNSNPSVHNLISVLECSSYSSEFIADKQFMDYMKDYHSHTYPQHKSPITFFRKEIKFGEKLYHINFSIEWIFFLKESELDSFVRLWSDYNFSLNIFWPDSIYNIQVSDDYFAIQLDDDIEWNSNNRDEYTPFWNWGFYDGYIVDRGFKRFFSLIERKPFERL